MVCGSEKGVRETQPEKEKQTQKTREMAKKKHKKRRRIKWRYGNNSRGSNTNNNYNYQDNPCNNNNSCRRVVGRLLAPVASNDKFKRSDMTNRRSFVLIRRIAGAGVENLPNPLTEHPVCVSGNTPLPPPPPLFDDAAVCC